ncbi:MAG: FtsX-like permease family protein, partial [Dehalococcoidia bacterium]|nr:FtsX-like permease family protein [Dehalococcoidia bacterium]
VSGLMPAWAASKIPPAEAMRTPAPAAGRRLLLERIFPFLKKLSSLWKIPLRNIFRNRRRSLYTAIGVTFGVSLILISAGMIDSLDELMSFMFDKVQRYDARIEFAQPQPSAIAEEIGQWEGVEKVELMIEAPTRMDFGGETYTTLTLAFPTNGDLRGMYTPSNKELHPENQGILLSEGLKNTLHIRTGDLLGLTFPWGQTQQEVTGFVKEPMGSFGYMSLEKMQQLGSGADMITGALLKVPAEFENAIREKAYALEATASVELTSETRSDMDAMMQAGSAMLWIMLLFGAVLAMAIVFTTVTVNILERGREIATMRTLGESTRRIGLMITIENLLLGLGGLLPGILMGYLIALYFFSMFQGDMFSMDLVIHRQTYGMTMGIVILIMLLSQLPGVRSLSRLDLAKATKQQAS